MDEPFIDVSKTELRRMFNEGGYYHRALVGELEWRCEEEGHPSPSRSGEPYCTRSQIVSYWEGGEQVARVHQYLRPDGSLGASGLPDPKLLLADGVLYGVL